MTAGGPAGPGVAAAGHEEVAAAAIATLEAGGNAFDAAVAAGFASAVAEPILAGLGGGGFLLGRTATGASVVVDFFVDTPGRGRAGAPPEPHFLPVTIRFRASEQVFNVGMGSVAVPGGVPGLLHVHRRFGRLPLATVLGPAVRLAELGVPLNDAQAGVVALVEPIVTLTAGGRALYAPGGRLAGVGDRITNPALAGFLARLPAGTFHAGPGADAIAADMAAGGGLVTRADLGAYEVVERDPLAVRYRDRLLLTNPPPAFGGNLLGAALGRYERRAPPGLAWGSPEHAVALIETMIEVDEVRAAVAGGSAPRATRGTTHVSVSDGEGNVASMTVSNGEGSGYVVPGTGVMLNNMLGEDDLHPDGFHAAPAGQRVSSMMSPCLLLDAGGRVELALGSGGSKRIRTALLQVITAVVDHGFSIDAAVAAPRLHWDGEQVQAEAGFPVPTLAALAARWRVNEWPGPDFYFGGVHAVAPDKRGAGDRRRGGATAYTHDAPLPSAESEEAR